ncbi:BTAD domain-containing putative transcriptional regulator [Streptomyces sp. NBC_01190]|uniref:AfsR/SARP family transcriptional regulator n=1 Tax=Streptomyces sp. NBC_01190 TaxID=2903767 RepID=UPI00386B6D75|nr:winged helix-turn-helix domain-containing protein [Streptomyces sp. NBC_01190]
MRLRILGPLEVHPHTPSAAKPRTILACLLVDAGQLVSTDTLIEELWGATPPRTARGTLQVYVSQLRKNLADGAAATLLTRPSGYRLDPEPGSLDLHRFLELSAAGERAYAAGAYDRAALELRQAVGLWRGPALADIPQGVHLRAAAERLDLLHLEALELAISADIWLGRHRQLIPELTALARAHPLRESLHAHLIVALYRSQQTSEALTRYEALRSRLADELGTDPGPALRELHLRVLRSAEVRHIEQCLTPQPAPVRSRVLVAPSGPPVPVAPVVYLPRTSPALTGRKRELDEAEAALREPHPAPGILVLTGGPGSGTSAAAAELAHRTAALFPDGRVFLPLRTPDGEHLTPGRIMLRLLRKFAPDQAERYAGTGEPDTEELADHLRSVLLGRRVLIALDGVRHEAQVRPLTLTDATLLLTSRRAALALEGAVHVSIGPLEPDDSVSLLSRTAGPAVQQDPETAAEIAELCEHLPLALRAAADWLSTHPSWPARVLLTRLRDPDTRLDALAVGDVDVRARLTAALDEVPSPVCQALRLLALAPAAGFEAWGAAALLDAPSPGTARVAGVLETLFQARLLEATAMPGGPVRYRMNGLVRVLANELPAPLDPDGRLKRAAIQRLSAAYTAHARQALRHLLPGWRPAHQPGIAAARTGPSGTAAALRWFREERDGLLDLAGLAHQAGLWTWTGTLAESLVPYCEAGSLWETWDQVSSLALDAARRDGDARAEAVALCARGSLAWQRHQFDLAAARFDLAHRRARHTSHRHSEILSLIGLADADYGWGHLAPARRLYTKALTLSRSEEHPHSAYDALRGLALVEAGSGNIPAALRALDACAEGARSVGDRRWTGYAEQLAEWLSAGEGPDLDATIEVRPGVWHLPCPPSDDQL